MHAHHKREHGSDGAHRTSTTRGERARARTCPQGSTRIVRRVAPPSERQVLRTAARWQIQDNAQTVGTIRCDFAAVSEGNHVSGLSSPSRGQHRRRWRRGRRLVRIDPARLDPAIQAVGGLRIDAAFVQDQAAKRRLNVAGRTAKPVVKIEVAKRRVDVVSPEQADHAAAEPDALGLPAGPETSRWMEEYSSVGCAAGF